MYKRMRYNDVASNAGMEGYKPKCQEGSVGQRRQSGAGHANCTSKVQKTWAPKAPKKMVTCVRQPEDMNQR